MQFGHAYRQFLIATIQLDEYVAGVHKLPRLEVHRDDFARGGRIEFG
jgi:hypothetical protein